MKPVGFALRAIRILACLARGAIQAENQTWYERRCLKDDVVTVLDVIGIKNIIFLAILADDI